jgi:hypothetical protein
MARNDTGCCWTNAQYPSTFWPNHRHLLHSADYPVFPGPSIRVITYVGVDQQQIRVNDVAEQKISMETTTQVTATSMSNNHCGEPKYN